MIRFKVKGEESAPVYQPLDIAQASQAANCVQIGWKDNSENRELPVRQPRLRQYKHLTKNLLHCRQNWRCGGTVQVIACASTGKSAL